MTSLSESRISSALRFVLIGAVGACREEHGIVAGRVWRTPEAKKQRFLTLDQSHDVYNSSYHSLRVLDLSEVMLCLRSHVFFSGSHSHSIMKSLVDVLDIF